jgi:hypothetical protein
MSENGSYDLNPVKVRVGTPSAFKQLTLINHASGRGAVGEHAKRGGSQTATLYRGAPRLP